MEQNFRVNEIASILGVSQTTVYKYLAKKKDRLKPHYHKEKGIILFDGTALEVFRSLISTADKEAVPLMPAPISEENLAGRLKGIEQGILALAEDNRTLRETMGRLVEENRLFRERLEAPPAKPADTPPKPITPWQPTRLEPAPLSWFGRLWAELVEPERLRALEG